MDKWQHRQVTTPPRFQSKAELRSWLAARRAQLSVGSTDVRASAVAINAMEILREHGIDPKAVALFVSFGHEPPTDLLISLLNDRGVRVLLPRVINDEELQWRDYNDTWSEDLFGIKTPSDTAATSTLQSVDAVFIPAMAASTDGSRLGRGAGFYDRALSQLKRFGEGGPLRIAVVDASGVLPAGTIPLEAHDELVDAVLVG